MVSVLNEGEGLFGGFDGKATGLVCRGGSGFGNGMLGCLQLLSF
jgi:hypothetical protein